MSNTNKNPEEIIQPGRLGNEKMTLATDPRTDPRMLDGMIAVGLDVPAEAPPVNPDSPIDQLFEFGSGTELFFEKVIQKCFNNLPPFQGVISRTETIVGSDGNEISLYIHHPEKMDGPLPCIFHIHGGGMVILSTTCDNFVRWRNDLAATGMVVVGVEFRNGAGKLGNHPFPAGLNDCASGLNWIYENRKELGVSQIVISGESGGGNLSISTTLKAKKEGWLDKISGVFAQCPYISGLYSNPPSELGSIFENDGYMLDADTMAILAKLYDPNGENSRNPLAWPYHASIDDLSGLPPHVISLNELDPLRDEGFLFHQNLLKAGVSSVCKTLNGTCHAGDILFRKNIPDIYNSTIRDIRSFAGGLSDQS